MTDQPGSRTRMVAVVIAALLTAACAGSPTSPTDGVAAKVVSLGVSRIAMSDRRLAPNLSATTLDGAHFALADIAGNVVVVNVWASWCAPCREESPVLAALDHKLSAQKVRFVGINETDTPTSAREFVARAGIRYPQLVDSDGVLLRQLTLLPQKGIPSTIILDRHGRMAARVIGPVTGEQIHTLVSELLQED